MLLLNNTIALRRFSCYAVLGYAIYDNSALIQCTFHKDGSSFIQCDGSMIALLLSKTMGWGVCDGSALSQCNRFIMAFHFSMQSFYDGYTKPQCAEKWFSFVNR